MLLKELIITCSHEHVAEAAVASIGAPFRKRVERVARSHGISIGKLAAETVRAFRNSASEDDWQELSQVCAGQDMPILCGLHHILETMLEEHEDDLPRRRADGAREGSNSCLGACGA